MKFLINMKCIQFLPNGKNCGKKTDGGLYCKYHKNSGTPTGGGVHHNMMVHTKPPVHRITEQKKSNGDNQIPSTNT